MTTTTLLKATRVIACLFVLVTLFSCTDHRLVVGTERFRLKTVNTTLFRNAEKTVYNYLADNRLASYEYNLYGSGPNRPSTPDYTVVFSYNAQNKLIKAERINVQPGIGSRQVVYEYDSNGRMKSASEYDGINNVGGVADGVITLSGTYVFEYGAGTYPTKVTYTSPKYLTRSPTIYTLTYNNVNITSLTTSVAGGTPATVLYTYDDKLNPYFGLVTDFIYFSTYSKNTIADANLARINNAKGLLIQQNQVSPSPNPNPQIPSYFYEYETY